MLMDCSDMPKVDSTHLGHDSLWLATHEGPCSCCLCSGLGSLRRAKLSRLPQSASAHCQAYHSKDMCMLVEGPGFSDRCARASIPATPLKTSTLL